MSNSRLGHSLGPRLRTPAAAEYLGIAASTLEKMRCAGTGPVFEKVGEKAVVYSIEALEAYLAQRRIRSTSETDTPSPRRCRQKRNNPDPANPPNPIAQTPRRSDEGGA
jgi:hypothetical protein